MRNASYLSREVLVGLGFASLGENVLLHETCVVVGCDRISIGSNVRIDPFCTITAEETVDIGSFVHISSYAMLSGTHGISVDDFACISYGVRVLSVTDQSTGALIGPMVPDQFRTIAKGRVRLGKYACIGANSIVLPGTTFGEGATLGALSLVRGRLRPWTHSAGFPARKLTDRDEEATRLAAEEFLALQVQDARPKTTDVDVSS